MLRDAQPAASGRLPAASGLCARGRRRAGDVGVRRISQARRGAGAHTLRVHNTLFWKRLQFAIEPGEHLEFVIINGARFWTADMAGLLGWAPLFLAVRKISVR